MFAARLLSVGTGLLFTLVITRAVTKEQYGIWVNANTDIIPYFTLLSTALPFWVMRFVSRNREEAIKTGVVANLILGLVSTVFYVPLVPFILSTLSVSNDYLPLYLFASILIVEVYVLAAFEAILRVVKIESLGYGLLIGETIKVVTSYLLVFWSRQGLLGAMSALVISHLAQTLYYLHICWGRLKGNVNWHYVKEWFKGSSANIYNIVGERVYSFGLVLLFAIGRESARAYYGASSQIASVVGYSSFLAFALYPRLLLHESSEDVVTALKLFLAFALPMTVGVVVLSDSYLTVLDVKYTVASPVLQVMALTVFTSTLSNILDSIVFGIERFDFGAKISMRDLVKTKIFLIFSLPYAGSIIVLPSVYTALKTVGENPLIAAFYTVLVMFFANLVFLLVRCMLVRKAFSFSFPWKIVVKCLSASAVMAALLLSIPHPTKLSTTLGYTLVGGIVYLSTFIAIDEDAKSTVKSVIKEVRVRLKFM
ncbi:MAG: hypothetical protein QXL67_04165 [Candidatus Bathyarchaeia archaeon]